MIDPRFIRALRLIHARLERDGLPWAVTGSLGMAQQGMDVAVHDVDLQTDEAGAYAIEHCLAEYVVEPVAYKASERMRSHLGKLGIDGIRVEVMGAVQKLLEDGSWEPPADIQPHKRRVDVEGMLVPVLSLEYEYQAYRLMGRLEKADKLQKWLDARFAEAQSTESEDSGVAPVSKREPCPAAPLLLALFYGAFSLLGVLLAYWFGLGWFLLMVALRVTFSTLPGPRACVILLLFGKDTARQLTAALEQRPRRATMEALAVPTVIVYFALALVGFWKLNIPLQALIRLIFKAN